MGPDEYPILIRIFNEVFHKSKDTRTLEWKYRDNPHGASVVWVAESPAREVVGSLAFVPRRICIRGREYTTLLAADGMILPGWQHQGIFASLLDILFEESWSLGAPMVIAFSGRRSVRGLISTNWKRVGLSLELVLPLQGEYLFKAVVRRVPFSERMARGVGGLLLRRGRLRRLLTRSLSSEIRPIRRFDEALAEAGTRALQNLPVFLVRDTAFLNWRYVDNPTGRHRVFGAYEDSRPVGYLVMETHGGRSFIADLVAREPEIREDLLATAVQQGLEEGGQMLGCMALEGDGIGAFLLEQRFKCLPRPGLLPFMIKMAPDVEDFDTDMADPGTWYLAHGDRDTEHMTP